MLANLFNGRGRVHWPGLVCLGLVMSVMGCSRGTPGGSATTGAQPDSIVAAVPVEELPHARLDRWTGVYRFEEVWDTEGQDIRNIITYALDVRRQGDSLLADFDADGYMTSIHLHCTAVAWKDRMAVVFKEEGDDNAYHQAGEGDTLLTLVRKGDGLVTFWGAIEPQATEIEDGTPYFTKDPRP